MSDKLWGGRFAKGTDALVEDFHSSISFDKRLYQQDIQGSIAHAAMLGEQGIISQEDSATIIQGLKDVLADIDSGNVTFEIGAEDIHMNVEKILTAKIGAVAKRLHTARSRNDQVALDIRMYLKDEIQEVLHLLYQFEKEILTLAAKHTKTIMPGYTHLQKAQPITFAHHMMAYFQMFRRDAERLQDCYRRADVLPLGSGALAGTTFPINRASVQKKLGFAAISENTLDGVSDRDFVMEFCAAASILMVHLSRLSEEIVLWSSNEFAFITLDDGYSTGSSIMPQKKNPDVAELVRGKSGRVFGHLMAMLTMMKGLPLAYNKDMQEDKEALFDTVDTLKKCLLVYSPMLATMRVNEEKMFTSAQGGFTNATDVADYLASHGLPFREAHAVVGQMVLYCEKEGCSLESIPLPVLQEFSPIFADDIYEAIAVEKCVAARKVPGGPAPEAVEQAIQSAQKWLTEQTANTSL